VEEKEGINDNGVKLKKSCRKNSIRINRCRRLLPETLGLKRIGGHEIRA
jgi:hypothetical protein